MVEIADQLRHPEIRKNWSWLKIASFTNVEVTKLDWRTSTSSPRCKLKCVRQSLDTGKTYIPLHVRCGAYRKYLLVVPLPLFAGASPEIVLDYWPRVHIEYGQIHCIISTDILNWIWSVRLPGSNACPGYWKRVPHVLVIPSNFEKKCVAFIFSLHLYEWLWSSNCISVPDGIDDAHSACGTTMY